MAENKRMKVYLDREEGHYSVHRNDEDCNSYQAFDIPLDILQTIEHVQEQWQTVQEYLTALKAIQQLEIPKYVPPTFFCGSGGSIENMKPVEVCGVCVGTSGGGLS